jgi:hypothetical protein
VQPKTGNIGFSFGPKVQHLDFELQLHLFANPTPSNSVVLKSFPGTATIGWKTFTDDSHSPAAYPNTRFFNVIAFLAPKKRFSLAPKRFESERLGTEAKGDERERGTKAAKGYDDDDGGPHA